MTGSEVPTGMSRHLDNRNHEEKLLSSSNFEASFYGPTRWKNALTWKIWNWKEKVNLETSSVRTMKLNTCNVFELIISDCKMFT